MQSWLWKLLLALVIIFIAGQVLSTAVTFVALASPPVANLAFCPLGSTAKLNPNPFGRNTESFGIICYGRSGAAKVAFSYTTIWFLERDYFHTGSYVAVTLLVAAWFLRPFIEKRVKRKAA